MDADDWIEHWLNTGGPEPGDMSDTPADTHSSWLTPATGWSWDADALMMGEYVGYPLYLRLRDRLTTLELPANTHDAIIRDMIDTHDVSAIDHGSACATLVTTTASDAVYDMHTISIMDVTEFAPLTGVALD
jgi:hypothetical protein